ncbi:MAG TPA: T9SS type A sorting domain-containing protein [Candidatus Kapabacteria bacterium]|nr:T9SS type A sorting domain-containing protein [Candidatus Kapabacteria bacterium]
MSKTSLMLSAIFLLAAVSSEPCTAQPEFGWQDLPHKAVYEVGDTIKGQLVIHKDATHGKIYLLLSGGYAYGLQTATEDPNWRLYYKQIPPDRDLIYVFFIVPKGVQVSDSLAGFSAYVYQYGDRHEVSTTQHFTIRGTGGVLSPDGYWLPTGGHYGYNWLPVFGATEYQHQIFSKTNGGQLIHDTIVSTTRSEYTINNDGDYEWTVRAKVDGEWRAWVKPGSFTLKTVSGVSSTDREQLRIYPHPAKQHVSIAGVRADVNHATITDLTGKVLSSRQCVVTGDIIRLDVSSLTSGHYAVRLSTLTSGHQETDTVVTIIVE